MAQYNYIIKKDHTDLRDKIYRATVIKHPNQLPETVDLRPKMSPICDQGNLGACTAHAIVSGLREYWELQTTPELIRLSRLYLYWHERAMEGTIYEDAGAMLRDGMKVLYKFGVPAETDYPYDITHFTNKPTKVAETVAAKYKITEYHRIPDLQTLKVALAEGYPVAMGMSVYDSFESDLVARTGVVPLPDVEAENCLGGHAVCIVGYTTLNGKEVLIVRNSWGENWGDHGYCYIPTSFIDKGIIMDMWTGK
jgi:C1A family cysteine protease